MDDNFVQDAANKKFSALRFTFEILHNKQIVVAYLSFGMFNKRAGLSDPALDVHDALSKNPALKVKEYLGLLE